jgi:hypothetical protein
MKKQIIFVALYLCAIILANLLVGKFGATVVIPIGFCLVGLDITTRDTLHELWHRNKWLKMGILIALGSLISWLLNRDVSQIAIASFVAFCASAIIDTIIYALLYKKNYYIKVNGSNLFSSFADSTIFLSIAFGAFMPLLILSQFGAKVIGGFLWSLVLRKYSIRKAKVLG